MKPLRLVVFSDRRTLCDLAIPDVQAAVLLRYCEERRIPIRAAIEDAFGNGIEDLERVLWPALLERKAAK